MTSTEERFISICESTEIKNTIFNNWDVVKSRTFVGSTIVHYIASSGRYDLLELLGTSMDVTEFKTLFCEDMDFNTPLHYASYYGHYQIVSYILEKKLCDINKCNREGKTPCYLAVINKKLDLFPLFFQVSNDYYNDSNNANPLHWGVLTQDANVIKALLQYNINICSRTGDGYTPIELAESLGYTTISDLMLPKYSHVSDVLNRVLTAQFVPHHSNLFYPYYHYRDQYERDLLELAIISEKYENILHFANMLLLLNKSNVPLTFYNYKYTLSTSNRKIKEIIENAFSNPLKPIDLNKLDSTTPIDILLNELSLTNYLLNFKEHKYLTILDLGINNLWESFLPIQYSRYIGIICRRVLEIERGKSEFDRILLELEFQTCREKLILNGFDTDFRFFLLSEEDFLFFGFKIGYIKSYKKFIKDTKIPDIQPPATYHDYLIYSNLYCFKDILLSKGYKNFPTLMQASKEFFLETLQLPLGHYREIAHYLVSYVEKPKLIVTNPRDQFIAWFNKLNLDDYMKPLIDAGYDTSKRLALLDADTLKSFDFPEDVKDTILRNIQNLQTK